MSVKVSVIMSIYNETQMEISQAVNSILNQSFKNFEFIIINDNPRNKLISDNINNLNTDSRIKIITNENNIGLASSLNKGIAMAKGQYIARMDADDVSLENRLQLETELLDKHTDIVLVSTNCEYIDESGKSLGFKGRIPTSSENISKILPYGSSIIHPSVMIKKDILESVGCYRIFKTAEDYDLWLRLLSRNYRIMSIDQPLIRYRIRQDSMTQSDKFLLYLTTKYQILLFKQRKQGQSDDFSEINYKNYLKVHGYDSKNDRYLFCKSTNYFNDAIMFLKKRKLFLFLINLMRAYVQSGLGRDYINNFVKYEFKVKGLGKIN